MFKRSELPSKLDTEIERCLLDLDRHAIGSKEYQTTLSMLNDLHKMKESEKPSPVSKDTMLVVGGNLLAILMVIHHEHLGVITTKALNMVIKPRA